MDILRVDTAVDRVWEEVGSSTSRAVALQTLSSKWIDVFDGARDTSLTGGAAYHRNIFDAPIGSPAFGHVRIGSGVLAASVTAEAFLGSDRALAQRLNSGAEDPNAAARLR